MATSGSEVTKRKPGGSAKKPVTSKRGQRKRGSGRKGPKRDVKPNNKGVRIQSKTFPCSREPVSFQHPVVSSKFDHQFDRFRLTFFLTTSILGKLGLDDGCEKVHEFILEVIDGVDKEMNEALEVLSIRIREETGSAEIPRVGIVDERRTAEIPSYLVRRYLGLFTTAERLLDAINYAETFNIISWKKRTELMDRVKAYLTSPHGMFMSVSQKIKNAHQKDERETKAVAKEMKPAIERVLASCRQVPRIEVSQPFLDGAEV